MATFLVINTNDSGAGSLRDAIEAAAADPDADTIKFASWLSGETIFLQDTLTIESGTVTINGDINGDGDPDVIISGDAGDDGKSLDDVGILLQVRSGANATIQSMHFTEAYAKGANGSGYSSGGTAIAAAESTASPTANRERRNRATAAPSAPRTLAANSSIKGSG